MDIRNIVEKIKFSVVHIVWVDPKSKQLVASGSGFISRNHLISNAHVFAPMNKCDLIIRNSFCSENIGFIIENRDINKLIRSFSSENNFDFCVLKMPDNISTNEFSHMHFDLDRNPDVQVGDKIAFAGYPLEHQNVCMHFGYISSIYTKNNVDYFQIDGSVNYNNSGGPLLNLCTGKIIGIITRKATGLTKLVDELKSQIKQNINYIQSSQAGGRVELLGIDFHKFAIVGQNQISGIISEIEKQANVGIGYAFSIKHMFDDNYIFENFHDN